MLPLLPSGAFFGEMTRAERTSGFHFVEARFSPDTHVPEHAHEAASLYLILAGFCAEAYGRKSRF